MRTRKSGKSYLSAALFVSALLLPNAFGQPTGCSGNGYYAEIKFLLGGVGGSAVNDIHAHVGDTLFYQVSVQVAPDSSCPATNVNAFLKTADGTVVQFLSQAILGQGVSATCPGNPACINTNLLKYTVRPQDVG